MCKIVLYIHGLIIFSLIIFSVAMCPLGTFGTRCQFHCNCKQPLDCNRKAGYCSSGCKSPWSGSNCQQENVSINVSTEHKAVNGSTGSHFAVDGDNNTCAVTTTGINGWWMLKFQRPVVVNRVFIKSDHNATIFGWQIMVGDDGNFFTMRTCIELTTYESSKSVFCDTPQEGKYLAVLNAHGPVVICELAVYVCSKWSYGLQCEHECACKDTTEQCDSRTGFCSSGCRPGRVGMSCHIECKDSFGPDCAYPCGHCSNATTCDPVTGVCLQKCNPGWTGPKCDIGCPFGSFGKDCERMCGKCRAGNTCNRTTGVCHNGCQDGFEGDFCLATVLSIPVDSGLSEDKKNTLSVFLGISATIILSVLACLIACLVANWRREDISKFERKVEKYDNHLKLDEVRHLNCNGEV